MPYPSKRGATAIYPQNGRKPLYRKGRGTIIQPRWKRRTLAIVGIGALGSEVCRQMAADGVLAAALDTVHLVDPDRIEPHNLRMSRLFQQADTAEGGKLAGKPKAVVAARWLGPQTSWAWTAHVAEIADISWATLRQADVLVSCADSALARAETALVAQSLGVPMLDSGVRGEAAAGGRVAWYPATAHTACYLCGLSAERRAALLAYAEATTLGCRVPDEAAMGDNAEVSVSVRATAALVVEQLRGVAPPAEGARPAIGSAGAAAAIRLWPDGPVWRREQLALQRSSSCPWHELQGARLVTVEPDQTFAKALRDAVQPADEGCWRLQFAWPVCVLAVCRACGRRSEAPVRLAALRRHSRCRHCPSPYPLEPLRSVASVGQNEWMAQVTPRQLGWAEPQLLQLRRAMVPGRAAREAV